jgi:hypothetical protein
MQAAEYRLSAAEAGFIIGHVAFPVIAGNAQAGLGISIAVHVVQ